MVAQVAKSKREFSGPRPMDVARDLGDIVDLLEIAFAGELGPREQQALRDFKLLRFVSPVLFVLDWTTPVFRDLFAGYVWEEDRQIVGNVTLNRRGPNWVVSNVAVHPDHRRQGIARTLMERAIAHVRKRGADRLVLQVHADNDPAQNLYLDLGFKHVDATTELKLSHVESPHHTLSLPTGFDLRRKRISDWRGIYELAREAIPSDVQRLEPVRRRDFQRGWAERLFAWIGDLARGRDRYQWLVEAETKLAATLNVKAGPESKVHKLGMTVHPQFRGKLESTLVQQALSVLASYPPSAVRAKVPSYHGEAIQALRDEGFRDEKTLDRMVLHLSRPGKRRIELSTR